MAETILACIVVDVVASVRTRPVDTLGFHVGDSLIGRVEITEDRVPQFEKDHQSTVRQC